MKPLLSISDSFLKDLDILDWGYTDESNATTFHHFESWVSENKHGDLNYLADHRKDLRKDLKEVYPEFQSALVFLFSYQKAKKWMNENGVNHIAGYALGFEGMDYHYFLKEKLQRMSALLKEQDPSLDFFYTLDTQPVLERDLAARAGLGWFGKNSMLINRKEGSYFIIGSILLNKKLELEKKEIEIDHCGHCNLCAEKCPTLAIDPISRTLNANDCLSTFTIETFKEVSAPEGYDNSRGEIFGCDICQDVCPWNKKPLLRVEAFMRFHENLEYLRELFLKKSIQEIYSLFEEHSKRGVKKLLHKTVFDRPGKIGWLKNLKARMKKDQAQPK